MQSFYMWSLHTSPILVLARDFLDSSGFCSMFVYCRLTQRNCAKLHCVIHSHAHGCRLQGIKLRKTVPRSHGRLNVLKERWLHICGQSLTASRRYMKMRWSVGDSIILYRNSKVGQTTTTGFHSGVCRSGTYSPPTPPPPSPQNTIVLRQSILMWHWSALQK